MACFVGVMRGEIFPDGCNQCLPSVSVAFDIDLDLDRDRLRFGRRSGGSFLIGSAAVRAIAASICLRISALEGPGRHCGAGVFCFVTLPAFPVCPS